MRCICDNCDKAEYYDYLRDKRTPATCDLWQAIYGDRVVANDLEIEFKRDYYGLVVDIEVNITECKGFTSD
jgi:hypothetical protein